jgi:hypothetical protein
MDFFNFFSFLIISSFVTKFFYNFEENLNFINIKYDKWKSLNQMVATKHKSKAIIILVSIQLILQSFWLQFLQYINNTIVKIDNNRFELTYFLNGKTYKMIIKPDRGPCPISLILDENQQNITERILMYYGPNYNWNHHKFTPYFFNCKKLYIQFINEDKIVEYNEHDYIKHI